MSESLPFERASARVAAPEWYDFHYFRRLKRVITPLSLMGILLVGFGIFIILTCLYVAIAAAVVRDTGAAMMIFIGVLELAIISVAIWAFAHDYEIRLKERRLTPYGRRFNAWLDEEFIPWIQEELAIFIDLDDAEELMVKKTYKHISHRGVSNVRVTYEDGYIIIIRDVLRPRSSLMFYESATEND